MKKPTVATRMFLIYGSALGVLLLFSILTLYFAVQLYQGTEQVVKENVSSLEAAIQLKRQVFQQKEIVNRMMAKGWDPHLMESLFKERENFQFWLSKAKSSAFSEEEKRVLDKVSSIYAKISAFQQNVAEQKTISEAGAKSAVEDYIAIHGLTLKLIQDNENFIHNTVKKRRMDFKRMNMTVLIFLICGIGISLIFVFSLTRGITRPLNRLMEEAKSIEGLTGGDTGESKGDEISELDQRMRRIVSLLENSDKTINEQRQKLVHAEKLALLGEVAAKIADEVRNPLAGIRTGIQMIRREAKSDETFQKQLGHMIEELNGVERILSEIISYACPKEPDFHKIDITKLLKDLISEINEGMAEKEIMIESRNYGTLSVEADSDMLKQLFRNIVKNAGENLSKGDRLSIKVEEGTSDAVPYVHLVFEDTGPGIPSDQLETIFKPFTTTKPLGTGLGLAICQNIVMEHKGRIWAENSNKGGLEFHIILPKKQGAA
jgi:signal transduction histidine kinase